MYREFYNEQSNFRDIFEALMLLLRWLTGEDWQYIMHDLASTDSYQGQEWVNQQTYNEMQRDGVLGWGSKAAFPFFISFFIINSIVILDLSIGVFITALQEAKKYNKILFGTRQLEIFKELWSDYDPEGTGWISVDQFVFFIFELPLPFGKGKLTPEHSSIYEYDYIHNKLKQENEYLLKALDFYQDEFWRKDKIVVKLVDGNFYLVNEAKGLAIKDIRTPLIVKNYKTPIYEGKLINFKHALQQVIVNAFESTNEEYLPDKITQQRFEKKWKVKTSKKLMLEEVDTFLAGNMILKKWNIIKNKKLDKFNDSLSVNDAKYYEDKRFGLETSLNLSK